MDVLDYIAIVRRRLWLILLCAVLAGASAYSITRVIAPTYEATATLFLRQPSREQGVSYDTLLAVQQMGQTYSQMMAQQPVLNDVLTKLKLDETPSSLGERIRVDAIPNTSLIKIVVRDLNAQRAANIANAVASVFIQQQEKRESEYYEDTRRSLEEQLARLDEAIGSLEARATSPELASQRIQLEEELRLQQSNRSAMSASIAQIQLNEAQFSNDITVVESAGPPETPAGPRPLLNTVVGSFAGFMIALVIAFLGEFLHQVRSLPSTANRFER